MNFRTNPPESRRRKQKRKSSNFGKGKSTFRLFVEFLPEFQKPQMYFNFYSRDEPNHEAGLDRLMKKVLEDKCKGRYSRAMLFEELTNQCLKVFLPGKPAMSYWDYEIYRKKLFEKPLLKAQVKFQRPYIEKLISEGDRHSTVLKSSNNRDKAAALQDLKNQLLEEPFQSNLRWADVYDQSDNQLVARINLGGGVEWLDKKFREKLNLSN